MSTERRCGNCEHWGEIGDTSMFRPCQGIDFAGNDGLSDIDGYSAETVEYRQQHRAVTVDGSGYHAALKTREDFGCELFEPVTEERQ